MRNGLVTWILLLLTITQLKANHLKGVIKDSEGIPLQNIHVQILNSSMEAASDNQGNFSFSVANGSYSLLVRSIGYADLLKTIEVKSDTTIIFQLATSISTLDEVVVSASKKEVAIINIPGAVTSLSAEKIRDTKIWELGDLTGIIPNFQYAQLGVSYQHQMAFRGISVFSETPSVATYIDGVIALNVAGNGFQLMDVERIEVLRGPQGTLYGRNAMGGVINIITRQPSNKKNGFFETSIGNQGLQRYGFGVKTPLIKNKLFFGLSGQFQRMHGFYTNDLSDKSTFLHEPLKGTPEDGVRVGDENSYYGNMFLKWIPNEKTQITFNTKFQYDHSTGASSYYQAVESDTTAVRHPYKFAVNTLGSHQRSVLNSHLSLRYYHSKYQLNTSFSFQHVRQGYQHIDQDLWPYDLAAGYTFRDELGDAYPQNILSHETRFSSVKDKKGWKWTAGAFAFYQQNDKRYAAVYQELALFFGMQPGTEITITDQHNSGAALFGEISLPVRKWEFTAGLRGDIENRRTRVARYYLSESGEKEYNIPDTSLNSTYYAISPKAAIQYHIADNQQLYLSYSRGFRAGGNNLFTRGKYAEYLPETSNNYELGYKILSSDRKYQLSAVLFFLQWNNMQLDMQPEPGYWIIDNIGTAKSLGAEIEFSTRPVKGLSIDANLGINHARYGEFFFLGENIKGYQAILAPASTLQIAPQYSLSVKDFLLTFRVDWRRIGKQFFDLNNTIHQPAYHLLNLRSAVQYKFVNLALWVQNATGTEYLAFAMPGYFKNSVLNRPRTFGTTIQFKF